MDIQGQNALVTGGTRGIGKAIAEGLARRGVNVAVAGRNIDAAMEVAAALSAALGVRSRGFRLDVSNGREVEQVFEEFRKEFSRMDILINNAGITKDGLLMRMREEAWDAVIDVNLKGVFLCSREAIKDMAKQRYGRIVNITSVAAFMAIRPGQTIARQKQGSLDLPKRSPENMPGGGLRSMRCARFY